MFRCYHELCRLLHCGAASGHTPRLQDRATDFGSVDWNVCRKHSTCKPTTTATTTTTTAIINNTFAVFGVRDCGDIYRLEERIREGRLDLQPLTFCTNLDNIAGHQEVTRN